MRDYLGLLLANLMEMFPNDMYLYLPKETSLEELRKQSGLDFGDDVRKWSEWVKSEQERIAQKVAGEMARELGRIKEDL